MQHLVQYPGTRHITRRFKLAMAAVLIAVLVAAIGAEGLLRVQQQLGPYVNLELNYVKKYVPSDVVNHKPRTERTVGTGDAAQVIRHDENGIRLADFRPGSRDESSVVILFSGDSFMEGGAGRDTIPQLVWEQLEGEVGEDRLRCLNAGFTSYSTLIYIAQMRQLLPRVRPDFVVVDFDETDLMDDWVRYRKLAIRDETGRTIRVGAGVTPNEYELHSGYAWVRSADLFLIRAIRKAYLLRVHMPRVLEERWAECATYDNLLAPSRASRADAERQYAEQIAFFRVNADELVTLLSDALGRDRVLISYHPHYLHLFEDDENGRYNSILVDSLAEVCQQHGVRFLDGREGMKRQIEHTPSVQYFRWPDDPFSHFTVAGMKQYSRLLAAELNDLLTARGILGGPRGK